MGRKAGPGAGWLILIAVFVAWCSNREPHRQQPSTALTAEPKSQSEPASDNRFYSPSSKVSPAASIPPDEPAVSPKITLYTTAQVRLRENPSTLAKIVRVIPIGTEVISDRSDGEWRHVSISGEVGWIHSDYLSEQKLNPVKVADEPSVPARATPAIRARSGEPIRAPYSGTCDCPYDRMRNGRLCGGRSAYSRPGGRSPVCYF